MPCAEEEGAYFLAAMRPSSVLAVLGFSWLAAACSSAPPPLTFGEGQSSDIPGQMLTVTVLEVGTEIPIRDAWIVCTRADGSVNSVPVGPQGAGACDAGPEGKSASLTTFAPGRVATSLVGLQGRGSLSVHLGRSRDAAPARTLHGTLSHRTDGSTSIWLGATTPFDLETGLGDDFSMTFDAVEDTSIVAAEVRDGPAPLDERDTSRDFVRWVRVPVAANQTTVDVDMSGPALASEPFTGSLAYGALPASFVESARPYVSVWSAASGYVGGATRTVSGSTNVTFQGESVAGTAHLKADLTVGFTSDQGDTFLHTPFVRSSVDGMVHQGFLAPAVLTGAPTVGAPIPFAAPAGASVYFEVERDERVVWRVYSAPGATPILPALSRGLREALLGTGAERVRMRADACGSDTCDAFSRSAPMDVVVPEGGAR